MQSVTPISDAVKRDKDMWKATGTKILAFYGCAETISELGRCVDSWKKDKRVPEQEMIDRLGFLLGDMILAQHGGKWVWVEDSFGQTPALQAPNGWILYALDVVSKRLRDNSVAEKELSSVADVYAAPPPRKNTRTENEAS
jgi:Domain of unknown function (DUF3806)